MSEKDLYYPSIILQYAPEKLKELHARLLATDRKYLDGWQDEWNTFEINEPVYRNPIASVYSRMIDYVREGYAIDYELEASIAISMARSLGKDKWNGANLHTLELLCAAEIKVLYFELNWVEEWHSEYLKTVVTFPTKTKPKMKEVRKARETRASNGKHMTRDLELTFGCEVTPPTGSTTK